MGNASSTVQPTVVAVPAPTTKETDVAVTTSAAAPLAPLTSAEPTATSAAAGSPKPAAAATSIASFASYFTWRRETPPPVTVIADVPASAASASTASSSSSSPPSPPPAPVSLQALAPPPAGLASPAAPATLRSFAPVLGGCAILMAGSVAYGVRYGKKHSQKMEENYAQYEVKPKAEAEIEVTPEMRRYALRRALSAFGIGTALALTSAATVSYGVSRYWEVYSIQELSAKLTTVVGGIRMPFESTATRLVDRFDTWVASTWFGSHWTSGPSEKTPTDQTVVAAAAAQQEEVDRIWAEAKRMHQEWSEGKTNANDDKTSDANDKLDAGVVDDANTR